MNIEGIVIFDASSGIPLYSKLRDDIDSSLFSSFVAAIGHFSKELKFGGLSSFTTEEKMIFLAARDQTITALITPKRKEFDRAYSLANELGRKFEDMRLGGESLQPDDYNEFSQVAESFLKRIRNPFVSRVAEFVHNEYGGEVSIKPRLLKKSGAEGFMDMTINLGIRYDPDENDGNGRSVTDAMSDNYIFCKLSDGRISRGEMMEFVDSVDGFGIRVMNRGKLEFKPYYPRRAVVIARDYTPQVFEYLEKLPTKNGDTYIDGSHVFAGLKLRGTSHNTECFVDVWKWHDEGEPEKLI
jgi:hypothetical protein